MKKKTREVEVEGVTYVWMVQKISNKERVCRIWKEKTILISETLRTTAITPSDIRKLIIESK